MKVIEGHTKKQNELDGPNPHHLSLVHQFLSRSVLNTNFPLSTDDPYQSSVDRYYNHCLIKNLNCQFIVHRTYSTDISEMNMLS